MSDRKYWRNRSVKLGLLSERKAQRTARAVLDAYDKVLTTVQGRIEKIFARFVRNNDSLNAEKARQLLSVRETQKYRQELLVLYHSTTDKALRDELRAMLEAPAYANRISRLEALRDIVQADCRQLGLLERELVGKGLADALQEAYTRQVFDIQQGTGYGRRIKTLEDKQVRAILGQKWRGGNFSGRIWNNNLAREKFLDGAPLDARAEYIQKTFDESSVQVLADALVREMHKMTMTVDMSDEQFAGNSSGQALKLKLLTMNLLAKNKMRRMEKGLKERFSLYNHWLVTHGDMAPVGVNDIDVVFTLSMPINESEIVQMVTSLQGIVDDRTLLSQLWFVRDPAEAAENIRRQKQENAAIYGIPSQADETEAEEDTKKALKQDE